MRRVREILRLKHDCGATDRAIARSLGVARSTVALTLERVAAAQLGWPLPVTLTDRVLEATLYASAGRPQGSLGKPEPDWMQISEFPTGDFGSNRQAVSGETDRPFRSKRHPVAEGFRRRLWRTAAAE